MRGVVLQAWREARSRRRLALAFARLLLVFIVIAGIAHSGARYFYCEALGLSASDPCLQGSRGDVETCPTEALHERQDDCCETITLPSVPNGARVESPSVSPAGVVGIVPPGQFVSDTLDKQLTCRMLAFARWRTPARSQQKLRAQLMVFLT